MDGEPTNSSALFPGPTACEPKFELWLIPSMRPCLQGGAS